jgi:predicted CXXCH cytochrome family protein
MKAPPAQHRPFSPREKDRMRGYSLIMALIVAFIAAALAGNAARAESNLVPHPPKARGEKCVADTDYMRRYHMMMLKHERDETVHEGVRGGKFSIKECVSCHAVNGADGKPVSYESPQHFCRSCHDYAAVSVDCFECHASRPGEKSKSSSAMPDAGSATALASYAQGSHP